jgi:hypothetical protein
MENKFREFWLDIEKGKTYFSKVNGCTHTIEIAAVEQLKFENEQLKKLMSVQIDMLEQNKQMTAEIEQLKSKLKLAAEALNDLFNKAKDGSHYESIAREALKEIES